MKISQIFQLQNKTFISLKEIFHLRCISQVVFPLHYKLNIDWDRLEKSINTFKAYKIETPLNTFYTIEMLGKSFFLVNYDKVLHSYVIYCTDKTNYSLMMNVFMIFSCYTQCDYYIEEDFVIENYESEI